MLRTLKLKLRFKPSN